MIADTTPLIEETCRRRVAKLGPDHPQTLTSRGNLAKIYLATGRPAEAIPILEATIPPSDRPRVPEAASRVVRLYEDWGQPKNAEERRQKLGPEGRPPGPSRR